MSKKTWFENWFDSPYYHILYTKRDDKEAKLFLNNLIEYLHPEKNAAILDLACGKGRHAIYLNRKGFNVTGLDLSEKSILHNKKFENPSLSFQVHDMRNEFRRNGFDYVFNLFTSFGYFENIQDNIHTLQSINANLKAGGVLVLDYINATKAISNLIPEEQCAIDDIVFNIQRKMVDGYIIKNISFQGMGKQFQFTESVQALSLHDFETYFEQTGFEFINLFGDYKLQAFDEQKSDRLILIARKKEKE